MGSVLLLALAELISIHAHKTQFVVVSHLLILNGDILFDSLHITIGRLTILSVRTMEVLMNWCDFSQL